MTENQQIKYLEMALRLCNAHISNPHIPVADGLKEIRGYISRVVEYKKEQQK